MNNALLLDALFVLFILLFALIGFWRGVVKEGLAAGGILFGALLADNWSARFGEIGSNVLNITANTSRFFTIVTLLLAFTLVVGYGSGSILVEPVRGLGARLGGAAVGSINAAFLLAFSLQAVEQFIQRSSTQRLLTDSRVAHVLVVRFNWFLLLVAGVVVVLLFGRLVTERDAVPQTERRHRGDTVRRGARLPAPSEPSKLEPLRGSVDAGDGRYPSDRPAFEHLAPMPPVSTFEFSQDRAGPSNGASFSKSDPDEWRTITFANEMTVPLDPTSDRRCVNCGEALTNDDEYCPLCGHLAARRETTHDTDA